MNLSNRQRNILGVLILLLVDVIWVLSSELTKYIFKEKKFNKPFFSTYLKSSLFLTFLGGFILSSRWRMLAFPHKYNYNEVEVQVEKNDENEAITNSLGEPIYVPINTDLSDESRTRKVPETEDDDEFVMVDKSEIISHMPNPGKRTRQRSVKFNSNVEIRHMTETYAEESLQARMSYNATRRHRRRMMLQRLYEEGVLPASYVLKLAMQFCFCWMIASYSYQMAISYSTPAVVNIISSTSSLFTLLLATVFPSCERDKFTVTKLFTVLISIGGVVLISLGYSLHSAEFKYQGILWSISGAFFYAMYIVLLRRKVHDESQMSLLMFFGFVGATTAFCFWPFFFILNWTNVELLEMPDQQQILMLIVNGLVGTLLSEVLWLWGSFLTSSLTATLSLSLTIPFSMVADYIGGKTYNWLFYIGGIPIFFAFIGVSYLTTGSGPSPDPIGSCFRKIFMQQPFVNNKNRRNGGQYEPLLTSDNNTDDENADETGVNVSFSINMPPNGQVANIDHDVDDRLDRNQANNDLARGLSNLLSQKSKQPKSNISTSPQIFDQQGKVSIDREPEPQSTFVDNDTDILLKDADLSIPSTVKS